MRNMPTRSTLSTSRAATARPDEGWSHRSPWTDPRALGGSFLLHATLLVLASTLVLRAVNAPKEAEPAERVMRGEVDSPIDNRTSEVSNQGGGGDPRVDSAEVPVERASPSRPTRDPAADALLSEILPTRESASVLTQTLPGPSTADLGLTSTTTSLGSGGAGSGGGSGGGVGAHVGPGTEFFGMRDRGGSYAYVIDRSGSMTVRGSLDVAKRELLRSLDQIPAEAGIAVVFYNEDAVVFTDAEGRPGMMPASPRNKIRVRDLLSTMPPYGLTDHMEALQAALALKPEVVFFLTDADLMTDDQMAEITSTAGKTRIHAIQFGMTGAISGSAPLRAMASKTGGSYRYIDVKSFGYR